MTLREDGNGYLVCPGCGENWTHVEVVTVGARIEDHQPVIIDVDGVTAGVTVRPAQPLGGKNWTPERSSRRHWIELHVDCENCDGATVILAQHKGVTIVETLPRLSTAAIRDHARFHEKVVQEGCALCSREWRPDLPHLP